MFRRTSGFGYFLLHVVEVAGGGSDPGYLVAEERKLRTDAEVFVVRGEVDLGRSRPAADQLQKRIRLPVRAPGGLPVPITLI